MAEETKNNDELNQSPEEAVEEVLRDYHGEVLALINEGRKDDAVRLLETLHHSDISRALEGMKDEMIIDLFRALPTERASDVLLEFDDRIKGLLLDDMTHPEIVEFIDEMETDDAADVISQLDDKDAESVLKSIDKEEAVEVQKLLEFPDDSAGGKMQTELVSVHHEATIEDAIEAVREKSEDIEHISNVFIVDDHNKLLGVIPLSRLILEKPSTNVYDAADEPPVKVTTHTDQEKVAQMFQRYDLLSVPVVDKEDKLVGRITIDDMVDVIEEEIFEDFYRMASLNKDERSLDSVGRSLKSRLPWLLLNLITVFASVTVIKVFASTIETMVILAVLMPIVAALGGNAAIQTLTVVIRGFALGELEMKHAKRLLVKEVTLGFLNGMAVGLVAGGVAFVFNVTPMVGVLLFLAMTANLIIAGFAGVVIPIMLKKIGSDPAISASVVVTTFTDVGGFFTFLGLAYLFIQKGLL